MLKRKVKLPTKRPPLGHDPAWCQAVSPREFRIRNSTTLLNQKKKSPATHYPEMVAPDYDPSEPVRSISPIVQELTKIKKRVNEVCMITNTQTLGVVHTLHIAVSLIMTTAII